MNGERVNSLPSFLLAFARYRTFIVPAAFLLLMVVLVVPLPPFLLDLLITANLSLAAVILLTTIFMRRPLDFSVFPALLLAATLFRLVLNVASTRLILTADAPSAAAARAVAGEVIEAFGDFVAGESLIVGAIIFLILVVVQFAVITKGATRMSEVAARFTLDALPGKQMAIDADLSAGVIDESEARVQRESVMREADFYGAMDGASKFVRGDAVAALIITIVNIAGGFAVAAFERGWGVSESLTTFTRLTIGDGLVSQVPAFIIAVAAGLIVARAGGRETLSEAMPRQLSSQPLALVFIAAFLVVLALTPLPSVPLLGAAVLFAGVAGAIRIIGVEGAKADREGDGAAAGEVAVEELLALDPLEIEIGYGLVPLVDIERGGDLLDRIGRIRRDLALDLGIVVPPIRIRDNLQLHGHEYRVKLRGATVGEGWVDPERIMAVGPGVAEGELDGTPASDPAFGVDALWIEADRRARAEAMECTVADAAGVLAAHLAELVRTHAADLLTREEVNHLLEQLRRRAPKLVEEVVPAVIRPGDLQKVMQGLLRERIPVRDLETIVETLGDLAPRVEDVGVMIEKVRHALRRTICSRYAEVDASGRRRLCCVGVAPDVEDLLRRGGDAAGPAREEAELLASAVSRAAEPLLRGSHPLVILVAPDVRPRLQRLLEVRLPGAVVLSFPEIVPGLDVETKGLVQLARTAAGLGAAG